MADDRQIFEAAGQPEIPDDSVDEAFSRTIREQQNEPESPAPSAPPAPTTPAEPPEDRNNGLLRALLDERERRQQSEQRAARYEFQERERQAKEQRPKLSEELFTDPDGTLTRLRQEWTSPLEQEIAQLRINQDLQLAHLRHGEGFQKAWEAWYAAVQDGKDASSYFTVMNAASPGEAMVSWFNQQDIVTQVGGDLSAYKQRIIDEYLNQNPPRSPNGQFTSRPQAPQPAVPTSISRMGSSASARDNDDELNDGTDAAIYAAARPSRRGER